MKNAGIEADQILILTSFFRYSNYKYGAFIQKDLSPPYEKFSGKRQKVEIFFLLMKAVKALSSMISNTWELARI